MMERQKSPSRLSALTQHVPSAQTNIFEILTCNPNVPAQSPLEAERFPSSTASPYPYAHYIGTAPTHVTAPNQNVTLKSSKKHDESYALQPISPHPKKDSIYAFDISFRHPQQDGGRFDQLIRIKQDSSLRTAEAEYNEQLRMQQEEEFERRKQEDLLRQQQAQQLQFLPKSPTRSTIGTQGYVSPSRSQSAYAQYNNPSYSQPSFPSTQVPAYPYQDAYTSPHRAAPVAPMAISPTSPEMTTRQRVAPPTGPVSPIYRRSNRTASDNLMDAAYQSYNTVSTLVSGFSRAKSMQQQQTPMPQNYPGSPGSTPMHPRPYQPYQ